jgi:mono/diheme cytochrome c family protein
MNDSAKKIIFTVLVGLPILAIVWIFSLYFFSCSTSNTCSGIPQPDLTPIPTLLPATLPAPKVGADAVAATPKCQISALNLIGAWVTAGYSEKKPFNFTDLKGKNCSATFSGDVQKLFLTPNLWYDGAPACTTCHYADIAKATKNMDLSSYAGILAGSNRLNGAPKGNDILGGGNWDNALLHKMLYAPNGQTQIGRPAMPFGRPASVPAEGPVISTGSASGTDTTASASGPTSGAATPTLSAATPTSAPEIARPSNQGGPGDAINQTGDAAAGQQIFLNNCVACHGEEGHGGIANPGSTDGTVPTLNPIDSTLVDKDPKIFATNIDLFIQHGSKPAGTTPAKSMPSWGDSNLLTQKQIADVIAYVIQINSPANGGPSDIARPSNPGGPGDAINQTGDASLGASIFTSNCVACHGEEGHGGIANPGSSDGTVPTLNPIDSTIVNTDPKVFATNIDLFIQHGSTPAGISPAKAMPAWGDLKLLDQTQIANVIAYLIKINTPPSSSASDVARPSNPGGASIAITLKGDPKSGEQIFAQNCSVCHGPKGVGGIQNPGSADGTVPTLNPIDPTLVSQNPTTFVFNLDLFLEHGSTPQGTKPQFKMPAWGDSGGLKPQQIADVISYLIDLNTGGAKAPATSPTDVARPSNAGGAGVAVTLTGDAKSGEQIFAQNCAVCHGSKGTGGVLNPGSTDGTVPTLNPIDPTLKSPVPALFAYNLDLFLEHGSTPVGPSPAKSMPAWGDSGGLTPQQIADAIAYLISLNK